MNTLKRYGWLSTLIVVILTFTFYQHSQAQDSERVQILGVNTSKHPRIEITVSVLDTVMRPVVGLKQDNFTVFEDDKPITIASVNGITDENIPLGIVLAIDTSTSMVNLPIRKAKEAAIAFVDQVRDIDELALVTFGSTAREIQPMTKDRTVIKDKISNLRANGETALYDAIAQAVKTAQTSTAKRRVIVLLTDGNDFGGVSKTGRNQSFALANQAGIPIFTIGLGFGIDRPFLEEAAAKTGGKFYLSPKPEDLALVYSNIATVLRSLYVISIDTSLPADGSTHNIRVEYRKGSDTGSAQSSARYPAPIPIVKLSGIDPNTPLVQPTTVTPSVVADNQLTVYEYQIDGKSALTGAGEPKPLTITPIKLLPGAHTLTLAVHDNKDHVGRAAQNFQIAVLPPEFTIDGLKAGETLTADRTITLTVTDSQTQTGAAAFDIDGNALGTADKAPYSAKIDVLSLTPGKHTFTAQLKNEQATGTRSVEFTVSPGPRLTATASAIRQATRNAAATLTAMPTNTPTFTPTRTPTNTPTPTRTPTLTRTPTNTRTFTPTPTWTATHTPTVPPTKTPTHTATSTPRPPTDTPVPTATFTATALPKSATPTATSTPAVVAQAATFTSAPTDTETPGATSTPSVTNTPRPTSTPVPSNTATPSATTTPTPSVTNTPRPTSTLTPTNTFTPSKTWTPSATFTASPTNTPTITNTPRPTSTLTPTNTFTPSKTWTPSATFTASPTNTPTVTNTPTATNTSRPTLTLTASSTNTPTPTATATITPTATLTQNPTNTPTPTPTPAPTSPLGGLGSLTSNPAVLICGGFILLVVIILMVLSGARRSPRRLS